jgi:putative transposase
MRLLEYCAMHTHWHLVLWPCEGADLSRFMLRLTTALAVRWHKRRGTCGTGPVYQGRFKAVEIENDEHLLTTLRYVCKNPLTAGMVTRAEDWRWSSLWRRQHRCGDGLLSDWPFPIPSDWLESLNDG